MKKTENFNLNQWEPTDPIRREDFNADNVALDAALTDLKVRVGSYVGDNTSGRTVKLGFTPRAIILMTQTHDTGTACFNFATADSGFYVSGGSTGVTTTRCVAGGVFVGSNSNNLKNFPNHYIAFV